MAWAIASIPFWIMGVVFFVGAIGSIEWHKTTSDTEAKRVFGGIVLSGIFLLIAAKVAS